MASPPLTSAPRWWHATHPVVQSELHRWRHSPWFQVGRVLIGGGMVLAAVVAIVPAACGGLSSLSSSTSDVSPWEFILIPGVAFLAICIAVSGLFNWLMGLMASAVAATLIAREREAQSWELLCLTPLSPLEIAGGKLAASVRLLLDFAHLIAAGRILMVSGGGLLLILGLVSLRLSPAWPEIWQNVNANVILTALVAAILIAGGLLGAAGWILQPYFDLLYNNAVGLFVSTFARRRAMAVLITFATHFGLGLAVYWPIQQIVYLLLFVGLGGASLLFQSETVFIVVYMLIQLSPLVTQFVLQTLVLAGAGLGTLYRVQKMTG